MNYFLDSHFIIANVASFICASLYSYQKYAKRWSASTGKYKTEAKVLWSSYEVLPGKLKIGEKGLLYLKYKVNDRIYNITYHCPKGKEKEYITDYPMGSFVPVFYSIKDPRYCEVIKPPLIKNIRNLSLMNFLKIQLGLPYIILAIWVLFSVLTDN